MGFNDIPGNSSLTIDRSSPVGNSAGNDDRGRMHVKIANKETEPLPITFVDGKTGLNFYYSAALVPYDVETVVATKTVSETGFKLHSIQVGVDNRSIFFVYLNNVLIASTRVYFLQFSAQFDFALIPLEIGDEIKITVTNKTDSACDAEARISAFYNP